MGLTEQQKRILAAASAQRRSIRHAARAYRHEAELARKLNAPREPVDLHS
jgi:hypothetical protein